ncbi:MAG: GTPase Era [Bacteroidetes bacterium]|nr:GTPase Era [Bacteroidota bacterium]MBK7970552.1 GTPase Era [Bacteroidota bacterium]MBK9046032.1 GTPase Era [Bacteroidota bacterium]MBL0070847.1 GTPase Era [Bacteroidota bacterium]
MTHKAGFVAIIGKPNVGKSTLLNKMLGEQLSVVTPKAQTTRHRIKGILNDPEYQIVFSDTPGIMQPAYKLHKKMMDAVDSTLVDADLVMLVVEIHERALSEEVAERLKNLVVPFILVINKVDLADQEMLEQKVIFWKELLNPGAIIPVSATEKFNIQPLVQTIVSYLPESPAFFDKEDVSDRNVRFFVTEIIREKILVNYQKEIPYSCEVVVTDYKEEPEIHRIRCEIYVDRESQKAILLGHKGEAIKKLGTDARKKIEKLVDCHIYLELTVKVRENWRDDEKQLDKFGYNEE